MDAIKFANEDHQTRYEILLEAYLGEKGTRYRDPYREQLAYLIALDNDCYNHRKDLYDEEERCIIPEGTSKAWQTSTSLKVTRLAFNLYTSSLLWCEEEERSYCTPDDLFSCCYAPYFVEALKIRHSNYFTE